MSLLRRIFVGNAAVLLIATLALVISRAAVSFPVAATEAVVLALGLAVMLVVNYLLLRRAVGPLRWRRRRTSGAGSRASCTTRSARR